VSDARDAARRVLRRIEREEGFASRVLASELAASDLAAADRGLATEIVYGVLRHRSRLDRALAAATARGELKVKSGLRDVLRVAAYQVLFLDRIPAHAAVNDAVTAARRIGGPRMAGFANGLLRRLASSSEPALPIEPLERAAVEFSTPRWIIDRIAAAVPAPELVAAVAGLNRPAALAIRVNLARIRRDELAERLGQDHPSAAVEVVSGVPEALRVSGLGDPALSPSFAEGLWTVQDVAAQRIGRLLAPQPGERVLDACAGVGGKATHLAELATRAGGAAVIDAADRSPSKLARLGESARRLGSRGLHPIEVDLTGDGEGLAPAYDAVLIDAPCTGLGVLRRHPEAKWRLVEADVARCAQLQARILRALAPRVRSRLVYAVCTFTREEGPELVERFCHEVSGFRRVDELVTWPHRGGEDGFYAAHLERVTTPVAG
jgi:16S rRNA (cytosine967-C5)-methyltransferase